MNGTTAPKEESGIEIIRRLSQQFSSNLNAALAKPSPPATRVELKARCISSVGAILREQCASSDTHREIAGIYDEVFADCVCSLYLAAQGLDKPAQIILRRALELGVAAVYLWDVPHVYWGWKQYDEDLSFNEMTGQLSGLPYLAFVAAENGQADTTPIFDVALARKEYRALSNTVHGKVTTFETPLTDRFQHSDADWKLHVDRLEAIQDLILNLSSGRFRKVREQLPAVQPQLISLK